MNSLIRIILLTCLLVIGGVVSQSNDVCLSLPPSPVESNRAKLQGSPGKKGAVGETGPKGAQGPKGEPGDVESCGWEPDDVITLKEHVRTLLRMDCASDGILYNNQCIKLLNPQAAYYTFNKSRDACAAANASLVDISSNEMYNAVYYYVFSKYKVAEGTSFGCKQFWLASTFEIKNNPNNEVTLSDGSKVRLANWRSSYPSKTSHYVNLLVLVNSNSGATNRHLVNYTPTNNYCYERPLCSFKI